MLFAANHSCREMRCCLLSSPPHCLLRTEYKNASSFSMPFQVIATKACVEAFLLFPDRINGLQSLSWRRRDMQQEVKQMHMCTKLVTVRSTEILLILCTFPVLWHHFLADRKSTRSLFFTLPRVSSVLLVLPRSQVLNIVIYIFRQRRNNFCTFYGFVL